MLIAFLTIAATLTSCSYETSMCPSYGGTKRKTSYGQKAQARYARHRRSINELNFQ